MPVQIKVDNPLGIYTDYPDRELPPTAWTDGSNIQFINGQTKKRKGQAECLFTWGLVGAANGGNTGDGALSAEGAGPDTVAETFTMTCTTAATDGGEFSVVGGTTGNIGTATVGSTFTSAQVTFLISDGATDFIVGDIFTIVITKVAPADDIHWSIAWDTPSSNYWVWTSLTAMYRWDGSTHANVTRTTGGAYTADADVLWSGGVYGDVVIANNGQDYPQYMGTGGTNFENFPDTGGGGGGGANDWPTNLRCKSMRPFKQYLIAMNLTEGATEKPQNVRWSTAADPGTLPLWNIASATLESGENVLSQSDGPVVDGLSMGDSFMIYKTDAVWGMQLIGGQYVMRFYQVFADAGLLNTGCVAAFEGKHFVVGTNDVYVHNGSTKNSVISNKVRNNLFQRIEDDKINRSYVVPDYRNREMLFCYVKASSGANYPNEAMVWNWESGEVSFRSLPGSAHISFGEILDAPKETGVWDADDGAWDTDNSEWGEVSGKPTERRLLIPDTEGQNFYAEGRSTDDGGAPFRAWVERTGVDGDQPDSVKHVFTVYPVVKGSGSMNIYVGGEMSPYSGVAWKGPYPFEIGVDYKIDCFTMGRALAIRFETTGTTEWEISSYIMEGEVSGKQ